MIKILYDTTGTLLTMPNERFTGTVEYSRPPVPQILTPIRYDTLNKKPVYAVPDWQVDLARKEWEAQEIATLTGFFSSTEPWMSGSCELFIFIEDLDTIRHWQHGYVSRSHPDFNGLFHYTIVAYHPTEMPADWFEGYIAAKSLERL